MKTIRAFITLAAIVATFAIFGVAHASARTCHEQLKGRSLASGNTATSEWTLNSCGWQQRVRIVCVKPRIPGSHNFYGGWIVQFGLRSGKTCPTDIPVMTKAYSQWRTKPGATVHQRQFFP